MLENCIGIINSSNLSRSFGSLSKHRPSYMMPFGGRYRIIDFMLSNMVNHGIGTVAVYTGEKVRSAMDHIGNGKPWELNRRINGLHIFPPQYSEDKYSKGDIWQYYLTEDFLENVNEENIYLVIQNTLGKVDLTEAYSKFIETDADVTFIYKKQKNEDIYLKSENLILDEDYNFVNIGMNLGTEETFNLYTGTAFIKKSVFLKLIRESMETGEEIHLREALLKNKHNYKMNSYEFKGHIEDIKDTETYYRANMNLLDKEIFQELFFKGGSIFTKPKDEPSTLYTEDSSVQNSIVANGCVIEGMVQNSIIFRGVEIEKGALVKDSIVMQKSKIKKDSIVVNSILDKYSLVGEGVDIVGTKSNPYLVGKNVKIRKEV